MGVADFAASTGALQNRIMITSNTIWRVPVGVKQIRVSACAAGGDGGVATKYSDNMDNVVQGTKPGAPGKAGEFILWKIFNVDQRKMISITVGDGNTVIGDLQTLIAASLEMSYETDMFGIRLGITGEGGTTGSEEDGEDHPGKGGKGGYGGAFGIGGVGAGGGGACGGDGRYAHGGGAGGKNATVATMWERGKNGTESVEAEICAKTFGDGKKFNTSLDIPADVKVGAAAGDAIGFGAGGGAGGGYGIHFRDSTRFGYYNRSGAPGKGALGMVYIEW